MTHIKSENVPHIQQNPFTYPDIWWRMRGGLKTTLFGHSPLKIKQQKRNLYISGKPFSLTRILVKWRDCHVEQTLLFFVNRQFINKVVNWAKAGDYLFKRDLLRPYFIFAKIH